ncbi:MAG: hypothetical protein WAS05_06820 [Candidatus Nanopelagicales bacterium]
MSEAAAQQVTPPPSGKRPGTVTLIAILIFLAGIIQLIATAVAIVLIFQPGDVQHLHGQPVSDWYWVLTAVLSFIMALIYFWIAKGALRGDAEAWMLINILAVINIVFALFQLAFGTGWFSLVINIIVLIINNTQNARAWYRIPSAPQQ